MKRVVVGPIVIALLLAAGVLSGAAPQGQGPHPKGCSLKTYNGTYLFAYSGIQIVDGQQVPLFFAGQDRANGDGTLTGVYSISINGKISRNLTYQGTYTVNPDCTGTTTIVDDGTGDTQHFDWSIESGGDAVAFVQTDPGFVAGGIERRAGK